MKRRDLPHGFLSSFLTATLILSTSLVLSAQTTERVSQAGDGIQSNSESGGGSVSANGRFVAFHSFATNLVPNDTNMSIDVFVRELRSGRTGRVSVSSDLQQGNGDSYRSQISAYGRYVVFLSDATNLVPGDTNGVSDVFLHDRVTRQTSRISVSSDGNQANGACIHAAVSVDGRFIAFSSEASNLVAGDTNGTSDVFLHDRKVGETIRVSQASDGTQANGNCTNPAISADGAIISFQSDSSNLAQGDTNETWDIFLHQIETKTTSLISRSAGGQVGDAYSAFPSLCASGQYVSFHSVATNLVTGDSNGHQDVFVYDRDSSQLELVSISSQGDQVNNASGVASLSGCGRYIAFVSFGSNLVSGDSNNKQDVFVRDLETSQTVRASLSSSGSQANQVSRFPQISANGRYVIFGSDATNLVSQDTNNLTDVFLHDLRSRIARANLIFVQFVDGEVGGFQNNSRVIIRNNSSLEDTGFVRFKDPGGNPVQVPVGGSLKSMIQYSLDPWGAVEIETEGSGTFQTGVIELFSDLGEESLIEGTEAFEVLGNFVSVSSSPFCLLSQVYVSVNSKENAGLALFNPDSENLVILEIILLDEEGQEQARKRITLEANQQLVRFVNEIELFADYFDENPGDFRGTLNIRSLCGEVGVLGLLQRRASGALIAVPTEPKSLWSQQLAAFA